VNDVMVLCYHAVSPSWTADLSVTPDALERQLSTLVARGWRGATFRDAVFEPPARRTLAVTFDDAFASVLELAHPILSTLGLPATLFAPTAFVSAGQPLAWPGVEHWLETPFAAELRCLSWQQLGVLREDGWEIGSHTRTHPRLTRLDEQALRAELGESRDELVANLGSPCETVAYPFGDVDERVAEAAQAAGYRAGAALSSRLAARGPHRWPRVGIFHGDKTWRFELKVWRTMRRLRASPLWPQRLDDR
jgi:peptidoglycan/xylan/chitin deacetylase (PgdA/CDA1 family)